MLKIAGAFSRAALRKANWGFRATQAVGKWVPKSLWASASLTIIPIFPAIMAGSLVVDLSMSLFSLLFVYPYHMFNNQDKQDAFIRANPAQPSSAVTKGEVFLEIFKRPVWGMRASLWVCRKIQYENSILTFVVRFIPLCFTGFFDVLLTVIAYVPGLLIHAVRFNIIARDPWLVFKNRHTADLTSFPLIQAFRKKEIAVTQALKAPVGGQHLDAVETALEDLHESCRQLCDRLPPGQVLRFSRVHMELSRQGEAWLRADRAYQVFMQQFAFFIRGSGFCQKALKIYRSAVTGFEVVLVVKQAMEVNVALFEVLKTVESNLTNVANHIIDDAQVRATCAAKDAIGKIKEKAGFDASAMQMNVGHLEIELGRIQSFQKNWSALQALFDAKQDAGATVSRRELQKASEYVHNLKCHEFFSKYLDDAAQKGVDDRLEYLTDLSKLWNLESSVDKIWDKGYGHVVSTIKEARALQDPGADKPLLQVRVKRIKKHVEKALQAPLQMSALFRSFDANAAKLWVPCVLAQHVLGLNRNTGYATFDLLGPFTNALKEALGLVVAPQVCGLTWTHYMKQAVSKMASVMDWRFASPRERTFTESNKRALVEAVLADHHEYGPVAKVITKASKSQAGGGGIKRDTSAGMALLTELTKAWRKQIKACIAELPERGTGASQLEKDYVGRYVSQSAAEGLVISRPDLVVLRGARR